MIIYNEKQNAYEYLNKYLKGKNFSKIFVLCDKNTNNFCLPILKNYLPDFNINPIIINVGEKNKNIKTCEFIWSNLLNDGCDRSSILINLGGGVITDIGGFTASAFKRGIKFINIPTSLLAMVDASTGGKTGIDFLGYKNMIGLFSQPELTIIDIDFLNTLEQTHLKSGFAEMLKHGLIQSKNHWLELLENGYNNINYRLIKKSVNIKSKIADEDPFESGKRKLLNFGHTIGHGIEAFSLMNDETSLSHGEAVAVGMVVESHISYSLGLLSLEKHNNIIENIKEYFDQYELLSTSFPEILKFIAKDKKNSNSKLYLVLLNDIGKASYNIEVSYDEIIKSLAFYKELRM